MSICVLLIFMFLIHYCCRYYTNNRQWNNETASSAESMRSSLVENVKGQSLQHTNITQTRRIKRELICFAQLFIFVRLIIFAADFNLCVCLGTLSTLISKMSCKSTNHQPCNSVHRQLGKLYSCNCDTNNIRIR